AIAALLLHQLSPVPERSVLAFPRRHLPELSHRDPIARARPLDAAKVEPGAFANTLLSQEQLAALAKNKIIQVATTDARPADFVASLPRGARPLVTADAALALWNAAVSRALVEAERERVEPELRENLDALGVALEKIDEKNESRELRRKLEL